MKKIGDLGKVDDGGHVMTLTIKPPPPVRIVQGRFVERNRSPVADVKIYQSFYDPESAKSLMKGFVPLLNEQCSIYFENSILIDIASEKKEEWAKSDYVGLVSWRFSDKTHLSYDDITQVVQKGRDGYIFMPDDNIEHPFHRSVTAELAKIADRKSYFAESLYKCDVGNYSCFCNYFIVKPEIFRDYIKWLTRGIKFLETNAEARKTARIMVAHRNTLYPVHCFFLEGLFSVYAKSKALDLVVVSKLPDRNLILCTEAKDC